MRKTSLSGLLLVCAGVFAGCSGASRDSEEAISLEDATYLAALEANDDGADEDASDATEAAPRLVSRCGVKFLRESLIERFDADKDGQLDAEERAALSEEFGGKPRRFLNKFKASRKHRLFLFKWVYDLDASGELNADERATLESDLETRCEARKARLLENFDADADGTLSAEEWRAAYAAIEARFAERRAQLLEEFDSNGDGKLDDDERLDAREAIRDRIQALRDKLKKAYDSDGDGKLNDSEKAALRQYLRERVRGEHWGEGG